jgi:hypothetical protein
MQRQYIPPHSKKTGLEEKRNFPWRDSLWYDTIQDSLGNHESRCRKNKSEEVSSVDVALRG